MKKFNCRTISHEEADFTIKWLEYHVLNKILHLDISQWQPIGSCNKKPSDIGDIDIAIDITKIALDNKIPTSEVIYFIRDTLSSNGIATSTNLGFNQISFIVPIAGHKADTIQIDFMLSTNLRWSSFIYYSPNFLLNESKYKGVYRNLLLMSILGVSFKNVIQKSDDIEEIFETYVIRLNSGIWKVRKSFLGKNIKVIKNPILLHEYDTLITSEPLEIIQLISLDTNTSVQVLNTYESLTAFMLSKDFIFKDKIAEISSEFAKKLIENKLNL